MHPKWVAVASCAASALLFLLTSFAGNIRVETIQPDGLPEIKYPYSGPFLFLAALGALIFSVTLSLVILRGRTANPLRPLLGSGLFSIGVSAILFGVFWFLANWQDEVPRCFGGCPYSTIQYYQTVFVASPIVALSGLIAAGLGAWLFTRRAALFEGLPGRKNLEELKP